MMGGEAQPGRGGRRRTVGYGGDDSMSFVLDYSVNNTDSSPSPPTSRVGFLLIRASIVVLLLLWSLGPMVLGLSSFWCYGPWVLWSWDCRPFGTPGRVVVVVLIVLVERRKEEGKEEKDGRMVPLYTICMQCM